MSFIWHAIANAAAGGIQLERFERDPTAAAQADLVLHESARIDAGKSGRGLSLPGNSYAQLQPTQALSTQSGTIAMWVSPLWKGDTRSHTFLSFQWSGQQQSYFALSQGWWEPQGSRRLHAVLSNQDFVSCQIPWNFDYTFYAPQQWTMLAVTWQAGSPGFIRVYVDGKRLCERRMAFAGERKSSGPVFIGSDLGATDRRNRPADFSVDDLSMSPRANTDTQIWNDYVRGDGRPARKWVTALLDTAAGRDDRNVVAESRVMTDEDPHWAASPLEIERTIARVKAAGFNVYMPCVWNGGDALFLSDRTPIAAIARRIGQPAYDPLRELIRVAHREGIQVHPWFAVTRRANDSFPVSLWQGAPPHAFNIHDPGFRDFIVGLIADVIARYDVDGINLDYIRSMGACSASSCVEEYRRKFGRNLAEDWRAQQGNATVQPLIDWNSAAVTDIVRRVSAQARVARPHAVISIDTTPFSSDRRHEGVNAAGWLQQGLIDVLMYMEYNDPIDIESIDKALRTWPDNQLVILLQMYDTRDQNAVARDGALLADYVRLIRTRWPGSGIGFYHYPHLNDAQSLQLRSTVFANAVAPAWPHDAAARSVDTR